MTINLLKSRIVTCPRKPSTYIGPLLRRASTLPGFDWKEMKKNGDRKARAVSVCPSVPDGRLLILFDGFLGRLDALNR